MEGMTFYGIITFVFGFVGMRFCFEIRLIVSWTTETYASMTFTTLNGPADYALLYPYRWISNDCTFVTGHGHTVL